MVISYQVCVKWQEAVTVLLTVLHKECVERAAQKITALCDSYHGKEEMSYALSEVLH